MRVHIPIRFTGSVLLLAITASVADGYIHFPPMTLPKMCKESHEIRILKIAKFDKERGVLVFEASGSLKGGKSPIASFKQSIRTDAEGVKPIFEWAAEGKTAVTFSIESEAPIGVGYVFIDRYCYSVDYNKGGKFWILIRAEPDMSACFHGTVEQLQKAVKAILEGKDVKVPVKTPEAKPDDEKRKKEINAVIKKNR